MNISTEEWSYGSLYKWIVTFGGEDLMSQKNVHNGMRLRKALNDGSITVDEINAVADNGGQKFSDLPMYKDVTGGVNEIFGFSKRERGLKQLKLEIEKAEREVDNYNFERLFKEPGNRDNKTYKKLIDIVKIDLSYSLPTVKKLLPYLFTAYDKGYKTGAQSAKYKDMIGIIPAGFGFALNNNQEIDNSKARKYLKYELDDLIDEYDMRMIESVYSDISKRIGWDKKTVSIPSMEEIEELGSNAKERDSTAFTSLFSINRFAEPKNEDEIKRLNKAVEYFRETEKLFR